MRIALVGYGKMGKAIESLISVSETDEIVYLFDQHNQNELNTIQKDKIDVIIEFTNKDAFLNHISTLLNVGVPIVTGTTGWYEHIEQVKNEVLAKNGTLLYGANFSIGANLLFLLTESMASFLNSLENILFDVLVFEAHHRMKLDAPSGTALRLAQILSEKLERTWTTNTTIKDSDQFHVSVGRIGMEKGYHEVWFQSEFEELRIAHRVFHRNTFAKGALLAARWALHMTPGIYEFYQVFKEKFRK